MKKLHLILTLAIVFCAFGVNAQQIAMTLENTKETESASETNNDLSVEAIHPNFLYEGIAIKPKVTIYNRGNKAQSSWNIFITDGKKYKHTESFTGNIPPNNRLIIPLPDWSPPAGDYTLVAKVILKGDQVLSNNTKSSKVKVGKLSYTRETMYAFDNLPQNPTKNHFVHINKKTATFSSIKSTNLKDIYSGDFVGTFENTKLMCLSYGDNKVYIINGNGDAYHYKTITNVSGENTGFTWDRSTNQIYVCYVRNKNSFLYKLDEDYKGVYIGTIVTNEVILSIACDINGDMYGLGAIQDKLYKINKNTGAGTPVGDLGVDINYAQDMSFDKTNNTLYSPLYYAANNNNSGLYNIDLASGKARQIGNNFKGELAFFGTFSTKNNTDIASYTVPGQVGTTKIDPNARTVSVVVNDNVDITRLKANFVLSEGASAQIGTTKQESGVTVNDFSKPVTYKILAKFNTSFQNWVVTVTKKSVLKAKDTDFTYFSVPEQTKDPIINNKAHTISAVVSDKTDLKSLVATFILSDGATAQVGNTKQENGVTINDFSKPVTYKVTAEDGKTTQNWVVTVSDGTIKSNKTDITTFSIEEHTKKVTINSTDRKISAIVKAGTDVTKLKANFKLSAGAIAKVGSVTQVSGVTINDFSKPVTYKVTAEDGKTTQNWVVTVSDGTIKSNKTDITAFSIGEHTKKVTINSTDRKISVIVKAGTDVTKLKANFKLSAGAIAKVGSVTQVSGVTINDFSKPVTYKVTAEDGKTTSNWTVNVTDNTTTSINGGFDKYNVNIYPNPSKGVFNIELDDTYTMEIIDINGKVLYLPEQVSKNKRIYIPNEGMYIIKLTNKNDSIIKKIIVN